MNNYGENANRHFDEIKQKEQEDTKRHEAEKARASEQAKNGFQRGVESFQKEAHEKAQGQSIHELNAMAERDLENGANQTMAGLKSADASKQESFEEFLGHLEAQPMPWEKGRLAQWREKAAQLDEVQGSNNREFMKSVQSSTESERQDLGKSLENRNAEAQKEVAQRSAGSESVSHMQTKSINEQLKAIIAEASPSDVQKERKQVVQKEAKKEYAETKKREQVQVQ